MTAEKDDVSRTLAYGSERFLLRHLLLAAILLLICLLVLIWPPERQRQWGPLVQVALAAASLAYIVFSCWRQIRPGRPRLVLSTQGIDQRLSHGHILHIPWDEVQDVVSIDHTAMTVLGWWQTERAVPAVVVSPAFYERVMPHRPWLRRSLNWGHFALPKSGTVQILFRHDYLGARPHDLRQAIEARWRAFSRHPNAKLPPHEEPRQRTSFLPGWIPGWAWLAIVVLCGLPALYYYWAFIVMAPTLSEATRSAYLSDRLDKGGVAARLADGSMARLVRWNIAQAGIPQCDLETTRDPKTSWTPVYLQAASCTAPLTLSSGARALAVFRLATETFSVEYKLGHFREDSALVMVHLSLEEADALSCRLGHCGPDPHKR